MNGPTSLRSSPKVLRRCQARSAGRHLARGAMFALFYLGCAAGSIAVATQAKIAWPFLLKMSISLLAAASLHGIRPFTHEAVHVTLMENRILNTASVSLCARQVQQNLGLPGGSFEPSPRPRERGQSGSLREPHDPVREFIIQSVRRIPRGWQDNGRLGFSRRIFTAFGSGFIGYFTLHALITQMLFDSEWSCFCRALFTQAHAVCGHDCVQGGPAFALQTWICTPPASSFWSPCHLQT